jgi:hypothetical protein
METLSLRWQFARLFSLLAASQLKVRNSFLIAMQALAFSFLVRGPISQRRSRWAASKRRTDQNAQKKRDYNDAMDGKPRRNGRKMRCSSYIGVTAHTVNRNESNPAQCSHMSKDIGKFPESQAVCFLGSTFKFE